MSTKPSPLPLETFGGIGMDGRHLRSIIDQNALRLIESQRQEIEELTKELRSVRKEVAKQVLSFCEGGCSDPRLVHGSGWNSAMSYVKSRIQREILS